MENKCHRKALRLSRGQRQRIGFAWALYRNPDVLIFDEATSSLDTDAEREIAEAIDDLANLYSNPDSEFRIFGGRGGRGMTARPERNSGHGS